MVKSSDIEGHMGSQAGKPRSASTTGARRTPDPRILSTETRMDRLVALVDHCTAAKDEADALGETFLSYLLAMTIQEGRAAMRRIGLATP